MANINFSVIICTADRPKDLERFLDSLSKQTLPPKQLIVVDAGHNSTLIKNSVSQFNDSTGIVSLYIPSVKGLTIQRNTGVSYVLNEIDIVSFFDDDIELKPTCLEQIAKVFENDEKSRIGGVGGKIVSNIINSKKKPVLNTIGSKFFGLLSRIFIIGSSKSYTVLVSGMNVSNEHKVKKNTYADWLHGCTSYRRNIFNNFLFDESLKDYSMREDLDFSYRVSKKHKLIYAPKAEMIHHHSATLRASDRQFGQIYIESWHWFVCKNIPKIINHLCFWYAAIGYIFVLLLTALFYYRRTDYLRALGGIKGLLKLFKPKIKKADETL